MKFVAFGGYSWHFRQPLKAASVSPAERVEEVRKPADLRPIGPESTERTVISREETSLWEPLRRQEENSLYCFKRSQIQRSKRNKTNKIKRKTLFILSIELKVANFVFFKLRC